MSETISDKWMEYRRLAHALQSGVAMTMNYDSKDTEPKHLRTGLNLALVHDDAVVRLLIAKGIFTEEEYVDSINAALQEEVTRYEQSLNETIAKRTGNQGVDIKLG